MVLDTQRLGRIDAPVQSAAWPDANVGVALESSEKVGVLRQLGYI